LKLKPSKCTLSQLEVKFLGHVVGHGGVATVPKKYKQLKTVSPIGIYLNYWLSWDWSNTIGITYQTLRRNHSRYANSLQRGSTGVGTMLSSKHPITSRVAW